MTDEKEKEQPPVAPQQQMYMDPTMLQLINVLHEIKYELFFIAKATIFKGVVECVKDISLAAEQTDKVCRIFDEQEAKKTQERREAMEAQRQAMASKEQE